MGVSMWEFVRVRACIRRACNVSASECSCASNMMRMSFETRPTYHFMTGDERSQIACV